MNIFKSIIKVLKYPNILDLNPGQFYLQADEYKLETTDLLIILGILINKEKLDEAITILKFEWENEAEKIIIYFATFAYLLIGDQYNDVKIVEDIKPNDLEEELNLKFKTTLEILIKNYSRSLNLTNVLGSDNDRANMYAVNAILNIKKGLGFDNFHIVLFTVYQSLELKLKHCLKKYIQVEPSAQKKQINFHNLIRLIKLISTTRIFDAEMAEILLNLRENLRYFEQINPGGQAARYEADAHKNYFSHLTISNIEEKELLNNFVKALSLLQKLYLKLIELYDVETDNAQKEQKIDINLAKLVGVNNSDNSIKITDKLRNALDNQIFGDYQDLINLNYNEVAILGFLIRIGFIQYVNNAIEKLL